MSTNEHNEAKEPLGFGETLRNAREEASYSVAFVTSHTHLGADIIEALEQERFEQLPGDVFIRGYIRTYTKLLELDAQPLIEAYEDAKPKKVQPAVTAIQTKKKRRSTGVDPVVIWSTAAVVTILVGLLVSWWTHENVEAPVQLAEAAQKFEDPLPLEESVGNSEAAQKFEDPLPLEESVGNSEVAQKFEDPLPLEESVGNSENTTEHQVGLGDVSPEIDSSLQTPSVISVLEQQPPRQVIRQPRVEELTIEAPLSGGNVDKVRIIVRYKEESWTEIFDARKRRLLHGLIKPGAVRIISGQAPLNVFLGNSPGVELEINGKPFDHSPYVRRNNTARFLIDDISS